MKTIKIKHKEDEIEIGEFKEVFQLLYHRMKHIVKNKPEMWSDFINTAIIDNFRKELLNIGCSFPKDELECNSCAKKHACAKLEEGKRVTEWYIQKLCEILQSDWKIGPRHTHHIYYYDDKKNYCKQMYFLSEGGVFIILTWKNPYFISTGFRVIKGYIGDVWYKMPLKLRANVYKREAYYKVEENLRSNNIDVIRWCTKENWEDWKR